MIHETAEVACPFPLIEIQFQQSELFVTPPVPNCNLVLPVARIFSHAAHQPVIASKLSNARLRQILKVWSIIIGGGFFAVMHDNYLRWSARFHELP